MELDRAKEILKALADGQDPATGASFPPDSPYQQADTVRALYLALEAISAPSAPPREKRSRPIDPNRPKAGGAWSPEEEQQLRDEFAARKSFHEMATAHGRTTGGITSRLGKLGLIEDTNTNRTGRGNAPAITPRRQNNQFAPEPRPPPPELTEQEKDNLPF